MSNSFRIFWVLACTITLLASCSIKKRLIATRQDHLPHKTERELERLVNKSRFKFQTLSGRFSTDFNLDSSNTSFNVSIRIRRDSIIWFSILAPVVGIEVGRAIITHDSIQFIDRINNRYFVGNFNLVNRILHADLDFEMVQDLFTGNNAEFYDDDEHLHGGIGDGRYFLSTIRKRKVRRVMYHNKELKDPAQIMWLDPVTFKPVRIVFKDFNQNRTFEANYDKYEQLDSMFIPHQLHFNIKAEKNVDIHIDYSKVFINTPQVFPFNIPSKYVRIESKEK